MRPFHKKNRRGVDFDAMSFFCGPTMGPRLLSFDYSCVSSCFWIDHVRQTLVMPNIFKTKKKSKDQQLYIREEGERETIERERQGQRESREVTCMH